MNPVESGAPDRAVPDEVAALATDAARCIRSILGPGARVMWFGSWVNGTWEPRSDIDIAIDTGDIISAPTMQAIRQRMTRVPTLRRIDLVDLAAASSLLRAAVEARTVDL